MRRFGLLTVCLVAAAACASHGAQPAQPEPPTRVESSPVTPQVARSAPMQAALRAGALVDTIVVSPDTLRLHVGQSVFAFTAIRFEARDSTGGSVPQFAPWVGVEDSSIVAFQGGMLVGRKAGTTRLWLRPIGSNPTATVKPVRSYVHLTVVP